MALHIAYPLMESGEGMLYRSVCKRWLLVPSRTKDLPNGLVVVGFDSKGKKVPCQGCRKGLLGWLRMKFIVDFSSKELATIAKRILAAHAKMKGG